MEYLDGANKLTAKEDVLDRRWSEHFENLLNVDRLADLDHINTIPTLHTHVALVRATNAGRGSSNHHRTEEQKGGWC